LSVRSELIPEGIKSHGDAIHYLRLPQGVIDPRSLAQIRAEGAPSVVIQERFECC